VKVLITLVKASSHKQHVLSRLILELAISIHAQADDAQNEQEQEENEQNGTITKRNQM
jgi:hypothetical protein